MRNWNNNNDKISGMHYEFVVLCVWDVVGVALLCIKFESAYRRALWDTGLGHV